MSGGHFNYEQYRIDEIRKEVEELVINNNAIEDPNDWGSYSRNYSPETIQKFKRAIKYLRLAYIHAQRIDWLVSGDDSEESFHSRLAEDLKQEEMTVTTLK